MIYFYGLFQSIVVGVCVYRGLKFDDPINMALAAANALLTLVILLGPRRDRR